MKKELTLVIMAAGLGSRFGGLKQIEPVGPNNEIIIDYLIYDAIASGFNKVVFIIKEENYEVFKSLIGNKLKNKIKVEYAFQSMTDLPEKIKFPHTRKKPLGTAHAIYAARKYVNSNFAVVNADDFYGRDAFEKIANFLKQNLDTIPEKYAMVGYKTRNTMTENGAVKRGICKIKNNYLVEITEASIEDINGTLIATPLENKDPFEVEDNTLVSMNMLGFSKNIFKHIEDMMFDFYEKNINNLDTCEYFIPTVITNCINEKIATMEIIPTTSVWHGVTYKEDKEELQTAIKELISKGEYPNNLWN